MVDAEEDRDPLVSVVIPCRDAESVLGEQLEALAGQTWTGSWEVIVADNGSRDREATRRLVDHWAARVPVRWIDAGERPGQAFARNLGAREARGANLLFCDADDIVGPGYVEAMARRLTEQPLPTLVAPRFDFATLNPAWVAASRENPQGQGLQTYDYPPFLVHAGGSGLGATRDLHEALGGFDESLPALEDTDYCWRAQQRGFRFVWEGRAVVHVRLRHDLGGVFRQARSYGRYNVLLYRRYRPRGMPKLPVWAGFFKWARLILALPSLVTTGGRARWLSQLGWRLGRLDGSLRYRVLAL